ncbi:MAG: ethanolamine ammonia-lyase reactivating factor EutA [Candidatus Kariarchaeaceae archaeon]|jgi:ethanolamine utilization protein EutA
MPITDGIKRINSVGIDVGTSTSHLCISELVLKKDPSSRSEKYHVAERHIKYRGNIFFTPLKGRNEIDIERLTQILLEEYNKAGIETEDIDTGAVIVTGESARKENADIIVQKLAQETGKFVAGTAGPNYESIISAFGSGAVDYAKNNNCKLIHSDVGGGTANIAVINKGEIIATACINVGGRLIAFNEEDKIVRLEPAGEKTLKYCDLDLNLGDTITNSQKDQVANALAQALMEVITKGANEKIAPLTKNLMMTPLLPPEIFQENYDYSFSGGVAEFIYRKSVQDFNDLGLRLGNQIRSLTNISNRNVIESPEKIRATVIGASEYTLQVSGSTTFMSDKFHNSNLLPIRNLPIVTPIIKREQLSEEYVAKQIIIALNRLDIREGETPIALAFRDPVRTVYDKLTIFSEGIVKALPNSVSKNMPIILVFDTDIGNSVGNVLLRETGISNGILSIDEIPLKEGDYIEIGEPIIQNRVFPVVIKSLIFG